MEVIHADGLCRWLSVVREIREGFRLGAIQRVAPDANAVAAGAVVANLSGAVLAAVSGD